MTVVYSSKNATDQTKDQEERKSREGIDARPSKQCKGQLFLMCDCFSRNSPADYSRYCKLLGRRIMWIIRHIYFNMLDVYR